MLRLQDAGHVHSDRRSRTRLVHVRVISSVLAAALLAGCGAGGPGSTPRADVAMPPTRADSALVSAVRAFTDGRVAVDSLSGVVLLARHGTPIYLRTTGLANRETGAPNRIDTKFNLASLDKYFTRIAIRQLQQAGRLRMSDKVGRHLPDYPNARVRDEVTIQHLYDMRSGLGDFTSGDYRSFLAKRMSLRTLDDFLALFVRDTLNFAPGTRTSYSNAGYVVLGKIVEAASGQSYYDYVRDHLFRPAGMVNTGYCTADVFTPDMAVPYSTAPAVGGDFAAGAARLPALRSAVGMLSYRGSSAGGGCSTAEDLLRLSRAIESATLLSRAYTDSLLRYKKTGPGEFDFDGWTGGAEGINTVFYMHSTGHTLIVLSNYDAPSATVYRSRMWNDWLPAFGKAVAQ